MKDIKIIVTTDIHGNIFPTNYTAIDQIAPFGLSRIATAIKEYRKNDDIILIDNGDSYQGTPLLTYAQKFEPNRTNPMAEAFNLLNYDYLNYGNHDFNYGKESVLKFTQENKATLLTSNLTIDGKVPGQTQIIEHKGKKIALIGVLTQYIPNWEQPDHVKDMTFQNAYETLKSEVARVKDSVDIVAALYHGGLERDPQTAVPTERLTGENQGYEMTSIEGLDLLITGHQHRSLIEIINDVLVTQCTFKGQEFVEITISDQDISAKIIDSSTFEPDNEFLSHFTDLNDKTQVWLDQTVGRLSEGNLIIEDEFDARLHKHPLVSLVNQIQIERSGAQLASTALFNGVTGFNQNITMRDLVNTYLYPNTAVVKKISGKGLLEMLEFSANYFAINEEGNISYSPEFDLPKPQHYNYDMVDGLDYTIKVSNPRGQRILNPTFQGKEVQDDDVFTLVVNNYRAMGGGNYGMVAEAETIQEIQEDMVDTIMNYFMENDPVQVRHTDNIHVIK